MPFNRSEELVERICKQNFLHIWSFSNPEKSDGDELCDALIVFGNTIIVISVKEIKYKESEDEEVAFKRWTKRAVVKSGFQVNKAINYIDRGGEVFTAETRRKINIPSQGLADFVGVIVAFGSKGEIPVEVITECKGKRFVVVTEHGIFLTLRELNTASDIIDYWRKLLAFQGSMVVSGHEGDLLAYFLTSGREFPKECDAIFIDSGFWDNYARRPERHRKIDAERPSLMWDRFIDEMAKDIVETQGVAGEEFIAFENAIRIMASENRVSRRLLAKAFVSFYDDYRSGKTRSRFISGGDGTAYVFLGVIDPEEAEYVHNELVDRMHVARKLSGEVNTVVGVGILLNTNNRTEQFILSSSENSEWTLQDQEIFDEIQRVHYCWEEPLRYDAHEDEYPQ